MSLGRAIMNSTECQMTLTGPLTSFIGSGKRFPRSTRSLAGRMRSLSEA
jgi:hypothetical protein